MADTPIRDWGLPELFEQTHKVIRRSREIIQQSEKLVGQSRELMHDFQRYTQALPKTPSTATSEVFGGLAPRTLR